MLLNKLTNSYLAFDMSDKIAAHEEAYSVTTTDKVGPCARSVLVLSKAEEDGAPDNVIRYGQKVKFESNPYIYARKLYLHSTMISPQFFARFSRNQEVCMTAKNIYNTVWRILHADPNLRNTSLGEAVGANVEVLIEHCSTS